MKKIAALALAFGICGSLFIAESAEARAPYKTRVNKRQNRQDTRTFHGAKNGSLTAAEFAKLQARDTKIALTEAKMRKSGNGLTHAEAAKLERRQDSLSKDIYHQKHDAQSR